MRDVSDPAKVRRFLEELGRRVSGPGRVYLVGGASALLFGWRQTTVDIDLKLEPEPHGAFEAIRDLKEDLNLNVELASPDQFIPPLPNWQARSTFVGRFGLVDVYHYDLASQALAKIERGHQQDVLDVQCMLDTGVVSKNELWSFFTAIEPELIRYPAIDAADFRQKVQRVVGDVR